MSVSNNYMLEEYDTTFGPEGMSEYQLNHAMELSYNTDDFVISNAIMAEKLQGFDYQFPYRVGVNYNLNGKDHIRLSYDQSYRWPSAYERVGVIDFDIDSVDDNPYGMTADNTSYAFAQYANNLDLKPESINSIQVGWISSHDNCADYHFILDTELVGYYNEYDDLITRGFKSNSVFVSNDGEMHRYGADYSVNLRSSATTARFVVSYAQDSNASKYVPSTLTVDAKNIEEYGVSAFASHRFNKFSVNGKYNWRYSELNVARQYYGLGAKYEFNKSLTANADVSYYGSIGSWTNKFDISPDQWNSMFSIQYSFD
jgi:hypothetical protein